MYGHTPPDPQPLTEAASEKSQPAVYFRIYFHLYGNLGIRKSFLFCLSTKLLLQMSRELLCFERSSWSEDLNAREDLGQSEFMNTNLNPNQHSSS
jgi:hypothetical protein